MADLEDFATAIGGLLRNRLTVPSVSLTTEDLDTLLQPAIYLQQLNANATIVRHYPYESVAGNILVLPLNTGRTQATQIYFPHNSFVAAIASRSFRAGEWTDWQIMDTRSTADRRYAPITVADQVAGLSRLGTPGALKVAPLALTTGVTPQTGQTTRGLRIPIRVNAPLGRWRLHVRNWNPRLGAVVAEAVNVTGLWVGEHNGSGGFTSTPTQIRGGFSTPTDGSEWVSGWHDAPLGDNVERLLAFGYTTSAAPHAICGGSYQTAAAADAHTTATATRSQFTPFDLWIEVETPASTPIIAGVGDSLTSGVGASLPVHDSWLAVHARRVGGIPMHVSHGGDSIQGFLSTNPEKVTRWSHLARADAVVWGLGSNDIASSVQTISSMQANLAQLLPIIESSIGPVSYASTVQPRNSWDSTKEAERVQWNNWLTTRPWVRGVLDFASVASADGDTLRPEYDSGDGTHLNSAGYAAEANSILTPLAGDAPATVTSLAAVEARLDADLWTSGLRDVTALATGVTAGQVLLRVKAGRVYLTLVGVQTATADATIFSGMGPLLPVAPIAPEYGRGFVTSVNTAQTYRVHAGPNGDVKLFGVPAATVMNGSVDWSFERPIPATPIGSAA